MLPNDYTCNQYGRRYIVMQKIVNHKRFIEFNVCRYIVPLINTTKKKKKEKTKQKKQQTNNRAQTRDFLVSSLTLYHSANG